MRRRSAWLSSGSLRTGLKRLERYTRVLSSVATHHCVEEADGLRVVCDQHLALGLEGMAFDTGDAGGDQVFGGREEDGQEAADDEVVELLFQFVQVPGCLRRRDDGEVVADLGIAIHTRTIPSSTSHRRV